MRPLLDKDYVELKIDTERHAGGEDVAARLTGGQSKGFPWTVVMAPDGTALADADGPGGNIGCPVTEAERAHFMSMLRTTRQRLTDEELAVIEAELAEFAKAYGG